MLGDLLIDLCTGAVGLIEWLPRRVQLTIAAVFLLAHAAVVLWLVP